MTEKGLLDRIDPMPREVRGGFRGGRPLHRAVRRRANPRFQTATVSFPKNIRRLADESYQLLRRDPKHPSLHESRDDDSNSLTTSECITRLTATLDQKLDPNFARGLAPQ